jgi:hypothetical protein
MGVSISLAITHKGRVALPAASCALMTKTTKTP